MNSRPHTYMQPEDLTAFGRYFEATCKLMRISHRGIAREAGIPYATLQSWVADGHRPALASLEKLFAACRKHEEWEIEPWESDLTVLSGHVPQILLNETYTRLLALEQEVQNKRTPPDVHN